MKTKPMFLYVMYLLVFPVLTMGEDILVFNDASQVLLQFSESRKSFSSFVIKDHKKSTYSYPAFKGIGISYSDFEYRFDGNRYKEISSNWGDVNIRDRDIPKEKAAYFSKLWDGETAYTFGDDGLRSEDTNLVIIANKSDPGDYEKECSEAYKYSTVGQVMGYQWGTNVQIDELFVRSGTKLQLREKKSDIHGVDCYVIDADVPGQAKYTVWIDPVHDFHIARIQVLREAGDSLFNQTVEENSSFKESFEVLEFEKVGDVWFPKTCKLKRVIHSKDNHLQEETEISFTTVNLSPDHDALGSFLPDDIPNGTKALLRAFPPNIPFIWQDGELVPG